MSLKTKYKIIRYMAAFMVVNLLFNIITPAVSWALTSGPEQPEFTGFEPVGTTDMVNLFSGDFNYNVPLLTVPGPNGGYPVNLAYHAGISMEQEASWVGLGWILNAGVINRTVRGLPDDFNGHGANGDKIHKRLNMKSNTTVGLSLSGAATFDEGKIFGVDLSKLNLKSSLSYTAYYNNYNGIGATKSIGLSPVATEDLSLGKVLSDFSTKLSFDSKSGLGFHVDYNFDEKIRLLGTKASMGVGFNTRQGLSFISFDLQREKIKSWHKFKMNAKTKSLDLKILGSTHAGSGMSFASSTFIPAQTSSRVGEKISFAANIGVAGLGFDKDVIKAQGFINNQHLSPHAKDHQIPSFGFLYSDQRYKTANKELRGPDGKKLYTGRKYDFALMDFNRENDIPVNKNTPNLPIPAFTYDVYSVQGQGVAGTFRPYRSEIGVVYDPRVTTDIFSGSLGVDGGFGSGTHINAEDVGVGYSHSYSGQWKDDGDALPFLTFKEGYTSTDAEIKNPLFEPYYFKAGGEMTEFVNFSDDDPVAFQIDPKISGNAIVPKIKSTLLDKDLKDAKQIIAPYTANYERTKRVQHMKTYTKKEVYNRSTSNQGFWNVPENYNQDINNSEAFNRFAVGNESHIKDHHVSMVEITNPDGMQYTYGIPAYNKTRKEVVFSMDYDAANYPGGFPNILTNYNTDDASTDNDNGLEHYYSSTETPEYAHSYLLTLITSPDYVDLKGDGPTGDDFGYYTKFNYTRAHSDFKWRAPFYAANFNPGYWSNKDDDKAMYSYGEKEVWYLNSIETKTHIAEFKLLPRDDGFGAASEHEQNEGNMDQANPLYKLDKIILYSKKDKDTPIKTVHFNYDYSLCSNVHNNKNTGGGKLTLKELWFTYGNNPKGALSKYQFEYGANTNYDYSMHEMDHWGNYKPNDPFLPNSQFPYTKQDDPDLNNYAAAWNLSKIILPSGGEIDIEYEMDDYGWVQDKRAMQLYQITGMGNENRNNGFPDNNDPGKLSKNYDRVFFKLKTPISTSDPLKDEKLAEYVKGIEDVYFKAYVRLKKQLEHPFDWARDYVEGYAEIDPDNYGFGEATGGNYETAYVTLKKANIADTGPQLGKTSPIRKAAWQYMRLYRSDLFHENIFDKGSISITSYVTLRINWNLLPLIT